MRYFIIIVMKEQEIVGIAKVSKEFYQDPTTEDEACGS
jgi:hypothetical protein